MSEDNEKLDLNVKLSLFKQYRLQWEKAQDTFVLLYPEGMVKLPGSSGEIMQLIDGEHSVEEIISTLQIKFPGADLRDDVIIFLNKAYSNGWIYEH
tara:strand:- start:326 stop:613 length:288 start_codon:yes stop_codon:yes gene_type:complete